MQSFVAIDFETAMRKRCSPIQIGVVRVIDGVLGTPFTSAVMPPEGYRYFDPSLTAIHHLTPSYIAGAPEWGEILERLDRFTVDIDGSRLPLLAHNASFERSVIRQTSDVLGLASPPFEYLCTLKLARRVDPASPDHKLSTMARRHAVTQLAHHDAGDDAVVCANLALRLIDLGGSLEVGRL